MKQETRDLFESHHKIDPLALDVECAKQPERFFYWAEKSVKAKERVDLAKLMVERVRNEVALDVRANSAKYGAEANTRITEGWIEQQVSASTRVREIEDAYISAKRDANLLDECVSTMETKKRMLDNLVTLHGQQYFAGPATPRDLQKVWAAAKDRIDKATDTKLRSALRKRIVKKHNKESQ